MAPKGGARDMNAAKAGPVRLGTYAQERGWSNLRLLSSRNNTFNRDYHAETSEGEQLPVLNVFARGDNSPLDPIWLDY